MSEKFIVVERIIAQKNARLLKRLPRFVLRYLKRILHQEEINQIINENQDLYDEAFCHDIVQRFQINAQGFQTDNIPKEGGVIFVVNHPLGGMDAMVLVDVLSKYRSDIKFIVNDILLSLKNLKGLFVGVNKHGRNQKQALEQVEDLFASDKAIVVFPAGLVSRKVGNRILDLEWKKTFITRAKKYNLTVVPVHLEGRLSNFFYRLARFRTFLGLKVNIEMLYLVNELFKQRNKTINVIFGNPIRPETFTDLKSDKEWAQWTKDHVYQLSK